MVRIVVVLQSLPFSNQRSLPCDRLFRRATNLEALLEYLQAAFFFSAGHFGAVLVGRLTGYAESEGAISRLDWQACIDEAAMVAPPPF